MNISSCPKCHRTLIIEELETHECRKVLDYRIEGKILWLFDGEIWYPRKLIANRNFTSKKSTSEWTEPQNNTVIKY